MKINATHALAYVLGCATGAVSVYYYFKNKQVEIDYDTLMKDHDSNMESQEEDKPNEPAEDDDEKSVVTYGEVLNKIDSYKDILKTYKSLKDDDKVPYFKVSDVKGDSADITKLVEEEPKSSDNEHTEEDDIEIVSLDGFVLDSADFDYIGLTRFKDDVFIDEYSERIDNIIEHIGLKAYNMVRDGETEIAIKNYIKGNLYEITQEDQTYDDYLELMREFNNDPF